MRKNKGLYCLFMKQPLQQGNIHFAIVGCGRIAHRHAEQIALHGRLVAAADIVPEKAEAFGKLWNAAIFYSLDALLQSSVAIDVLVVCTPNGLHAAHSIAALNKGMHVLCEKPMAIHSNDCLAMIEAAEKNQAQLFVVKQNRFNPPVLALKKAVDENMLGDIYSIQLNCFWNRGNDYYASSWKGTKDLDGGTLYTQFSHFIDLLYWILGDVQKVLALTANLAHTNSIAFEDTGVVALEFASGALGTIHFTVNSFAKNMEGSLTVFGEKGTVKIGGQYLNELEYQCIEGYEIKDISPGKPANEYGSYSGSMSNHDKVYAAVVDALTNGREFANLYDAFKTVEIIEKIYAAADKQQRR